jgi:nucleoside-triphosphatase
LVRPPCCAKSHHTQQYRLGGFYTEEIRQAGQRKGFRPVTFRGEERTIAHVKLDHRYRVSKYGVDIATVDRFAETELALTDAVDVYLIDEIGKMECFSSTFVDKIKVLLNSNKPVIATVAVKGSGLIAKAKRWRRSELWELSHNDRYAPVTQLVEWLETRI